MKGFEITGRYTSAKIFTDYVEPEALQLVWNIINHPAYENKSVRCMPDIHAGKGITIGFTAPLGNMINPSHIGCDIGCSMTSLYFPGILKGTDYAKVENLIRERIPFGFDLQKSTIVDMKAFYAFMNRRMEHCRLQWPEMVNRMEVNEKTLNQFLKRIGMDASVFWRSLGTVGGGNHFIECGISKDGDTVWTIHCGSRNLGQKVFKYWDKVSKAAPYDKDDLKKEIERIKSECKDKSQLERLIKDATENAKKKHPNGYLVSLEDRKGYLTDLFFAQGYAAFNHLTIGAEIEGIMRECGYGEFFREIYCVHNYINPRDHMIRKGAISSYEGEYLIIPFNMRDGLAICKGKSNPDWNFSAPHGAGRIMSRAAAKENVDLDEFKSSMEGIYTTCVGIGTLDESPMAYKPYQQIIEAIEPTAEVIDLIKPIINLKAYNSVE